MEVVAGRIRGLIITLMGILTVDECEEVERFLDHAEYGEALLTLAWIINDEERVVSPAILGVIQDLATQLGTTQDLPPGLQPPAANCRRDPKSKVTTREYDNVGNLKLLKQPTGAGAFTTTSYFYTARNEIDYETDPSDALHFIDYVYDDEGRQEFRYDRRNNGVDGTIERTTEQIFRTVRTRD